MINAMGTSTVAVTLKIKCTLDEKVIFDLIWIFLALKRSDNHFKYAINTFLKRLREQIDSLNEIQQVSKVERLLKSNSNVELSPNAFARQNRGIQFISAFALATWSW